MFEHAFDDRILTRLLLATCAGWILGIPYRNRPGGIRAHVLVTLGAAYFCTTAIRVMWRETADVIRVIQGVTSGIGFVGAASVLKQDGTVHGISTAASIWIAAAVGCDAALGTGFLVLITAPVITLLTIVVEKLEQRGLRRNQQVLSRHRHFFVHRNLRHRDVGPPASPPHRPPPITDPRSSSPTPFWAGPGARGSSVMRGPIADPDALESEEAPQ